MSKAIITIESDDDDDMAQLQVNVEFDPPITKGEASHAARVAAQMLDVIVEDADRVETHVHGPRN